ncbi:isochorismate synthase MenF [Enterobacteriaceae bacterium RIT691]|nr:isochorismate synthase MenF [Enterobacteriaceae bacterium RIT691]
MHSITVALESLQASLAEAMPDAPGTRIFDVSFPLNDAFDPLSWLCGQTQFPQFYWQHRNGHQEVAALGAVRHFDSLAEANLFLQAQTDDLQIWGLNAFTPACGSLFLPRLRWRREAGKASLRLTLHSDVSLRTDAQQAQASLCALLPSHPLPALNTELSAERHYPDKAGWVRMIEAATDTIATGKMDKVALARATDLHFATSLNAGAMMAASRRVNLNCYHFLQRFDAQTAFLGSSPERLWRRQGTQLETEALAGTVVNHPDDRQAKHYADWLMQDDKNQRENLLVVEDICERLQQDVSSLEVLPPEVVRLRKVQHLRRCIQAELKSADDARCQHQLQPTAAVAGLPREPARQFIEQHEPFTREWYAGSAGYLGKQQSEFCVTLRSAKVAGNVVRLYAGAGIVRGSDPELEWQEITQKAAGLRSLLLSD